MSEARSGWGRLWAVAALVLAACMAPGGTVQGQWISPLWGSTYSFRAEGTEAVVRVALQVDTGAKLDSLRLVGARAGATYDDALFRAVRVSLETGPLSSALIALDLRTLARPDTLDLIVRAFRAEGAPEDLQLHLVRPAAVLRDPGSVRVERISWAPWGDRDPALTLLEISGQSEVTGLALRSLPFTNGDERQVEVVVSADLAEGATLRTSGALRLPYRLEGSIPHGTTRGIALLTAPQLAQPVQLQFEIVKRPSLWTLAAVILAGLLVGFYVRVHLERRKELGRARLQAESFMKQLAEAGRRYADPDFGLVVNTQSRELREAVTGSDAGDTEGVTARTEKAQAALEEALVTLKAALSAQEERRKGLGKLTSRVWMLPDSMDEAIEALRRRDPAVRDALEAGDAAGARARLDAAELELAQALTRTFEAWRPGLLQDYRALVAETSPVPLTVRRDLQSAVQALITELEAIPTPPQTGAADQVTPTLEAVHVHRQKSREVFRSVVGSVRTLEARLRDTLDPLPSLDRWSPIAASVAELQSAVGDEVELEGALASLTDRSRWRRWTQAIESQAVGTIPGLGEALASGDLLGAAGLIAGARSRDAALGDREAEPAGAPAGGEKDILASFNPPRAVAGPGSATLPGMPEAAMLESIRVRSAREIAWANQVQFLVSTILITVIGVVIFAGDYVGSGMNLVGAFFWGFTLDIALATVTEKVTQLPGVGG